MVSGDKVAVIKVLLNGLNNQKIDVKGTAYQGVMPAWKGQLTNKQIADVITYIRTSWGNKGTPVTEAEVAAQAK